MQWNIFWGYPWSLGEGLDEIYQEAFLYRPNWGCKSSSLSCIIVAGILTHTDSSTEPQLNLKSRQLSGLHWVVPTLGHHKIPLFRAKRRWSVSHINLSDRLDALMFVLWRLQKEVLFVVLGWWDIWIPIFYLWKLNLYRKNFETNEGFFKGTESFWLGLI